MKIKLLKHIILFLLPMTVFVSDFSDDLVKNAPDYNFTNLTREISHSFHIKDKIIKIDIPVFEESTSASKDISGFFSPALRPQLLQFHQHLLSAYYLSAALPKNKEIGFRFKALLKT